MVQLVTMFLQGSQDDCKGKSLSCSHRWGSIYVVIHFVSLECWNERRAMLQKCIRLTFISPPHFAIFLKTDLWSTSHILANVSTTSLSRFLFLNIPKAACTSYWQGAILGIANILRVVSLLSPLRNPKTQEQICKEWISLCLSPLHC